MDFKLVSQVEKGVFLDSNFVKLAKWSPDGLCILSKSNDQLIRLFEISDKETFSPSLMCREGEDILDFCWYPTMQSNDPSTCLFLSTCKDHPIHLWDAYTGKSKVSYIAYDGMDEPKSAYSLCFSPAGDKVFGGYNKSICIWDTSIPGRSYKEFTTSSTKQRSKKRQIDDDISLNGIISVLSCNPDQSGIIACGSFNGGIGLYDYNNNMDPLCILWGHDGGITHLKWSPCGNYLYSGGRKDNFIRCWDIRNTQSILFKLPRLCNTNQRLHFDVDPTGQFLASGNQQGDLLVYDLNENGKLLQQTKLHNDSLSSVQFHPYHPYIVTSAGQRHGHFSESEDEIEVFENSIKIWNFPYISNQIIEIPQTFSPCNNEAIIDENAQSTLNSFIEVRPHWIQQQRQQRQQRQHTEAHWLQLIMEET